MILTDEQLALTKESLNKFEDAYIQASERLDPLGAMEKSAIKSTIEQLNSEIKTYTDAREKNIALKNELDNERLTE